MHKRPIAVLTLVLAASLAVGQTKPALTASAPATATASAPTASPEAMAVLARLETAGTSLIEADVDYHVELVQVGDTEDRTGKVYFVPETPQTAGKFRIHFDTLRNGNGAKTKAVEDYVFDGEWLTIRKERAKQFQRLQVAPTGQRLPAMKLGQGPFPVPFGQKAQDVVKYFAVSTDPVAKPGAKPAATAPANADYLRLTTRPERQRDLSVTWMEMWVDKTTGLPVKIIAEDTSENVTTAVFTKIATPKEFAKDTFDLPRPPADWEVTVKPYGK